MVKKLILGYDTAVEYPAVNSRELNGFMRLYASTPHEYFEVTHCHLFLGYSPLLFGIFFQDNVKEASILRSHSQLCLSFSPQSFTPGKKWRNYFTSDNAVARLEAVKVQEKKIEGYTLFLFEGKWAEHRLLNIFHRQMNAIYHAMRPTRKGNVNVPGNLYEQVRVMYLFPRRISIVSVGNEKRYNLFPTDLHGEIGPSLYIDSLRRAGKACQQVDELEKICIADVHFSWYRKAHAMGKNHMKELQTRDAFEIYTAGSENMNLPLPAGVISYRELVKREHFDLGIHRIQLFDIINKKTIDAAAPTLACIHRFYLQWRMNQGLETRYAT